MKQKKRQHGGRREGAGRPQLAREVRVIRCRLSRADVEQLDKRAAKQDISRSEAIREAILDWIAQ
jgi:hypothetical protein